MSELWLENPVDRSWSAVPLVAEAHAAVSGEPLVAVAALAVPQLHAVAGLWVLLASETVRVNAVPVFGGVRVLRDGDEIRVGARRAFFSTHSPARVEPFPGAARAVRCPRCAQPIEAGAPAVRSRCGVWLHQSDEWPCWRHTPRCPECDEATALDALPAWSPEAL